jgi:hypothetical protein
LQEFQIQASEVPKVPRATAATALRWRKRFLAAFLTTLVNIAIHREVKIMILLRKKKLLMKKEMKMTKTLKNKSK